MRTQTPSVAELPTADDFRAVHFVSLKWRPAPSEDIAAQPPKIVTDAEQPTPSEDERPTPSEDISAQPTKIVTLAERSAPSEDIAAQQDADFDTTRFLYRMK